MSTADTTPTPKKTPPAEAYTQVGIPKKLHAIITNEANARGMRIGRFTEELLRYALDNLGMPKSMFDERP